MNYTSIIGLEIHVQLRTHSKMFCSCPNAFDQENPNKYTCPICLGHPGTLPVLNKQALEYGLMVALALGCEIPATSKFDRKNYFYPDLPKGYQISQYDQPIGQKGHLIISHEGQRIRVGINRAHLEEDAAKLMHPAGSDSSLVDYNRGGTPLIEIVTEPHLRSPEAARTFLQELKLIMQYLGVSQADMEKGQLRCDANISLQPEDDATLYPKTEIKNLNSFRSVEKGLHYEIKRQKALWEKGTPPTILETRGWNDEKGITESQRTKEEASDYRYFPEPDIPPLHFTKEYIQTFQERIPELPDQKRKRFMAEYGISLAEAVTLTGSREVSEYFEECISEAGAWIESKTQEAVLENADFTRMIKLTVNWITTELFKLMKEKGIDIKDVKITPENMAELMVMLMQKEINSSAGQTIFREMFEKGVDPSHIADEKNLRQVSDMQVIEQVVEKVIGENEKVCEEYKKGRENALQYLVGQVMKTMKGKANPQVAGELLKKKLKG